MASADIAPHGEFVSNRDYIDFSAGVRDLVHKNFGFGGCCSAWEIRLQRDGRGQEWRHQLGVDRGGICRTWMEAALTGHSWRHQLGVRFLHLPLVRVGEVAVYKPLRYFIAHSKLIQHIIKSDVLYRPDLRALKRHNYAKGRGAVSYTWS